MSTDRETKVRGPFALRRPPLDWAHRAAAGTLDRLSWVNSAIDTDGRDQVAFHYSEDGRVKFQQRSYGQMLPPSIAMAAMQAQADGHVTAWEVLILLFAQSEWMVACREEMWTPWSPVPRLLAQLVEAFGVEPSLHRYNSENLARLVALLPRWHPHRGTVTRAEEILEATNQIDQVQGVFERDSIGDELDEEVFACHGSKWWTTRQEKGAAKAFRITGGVLRFQPTGTFGSSSPGVSGKELGGVGDPSAAPRYRAPRGDIVLRWREGSPLPLDLFRLLPAWTVVRPVIVTEE